jgi:uncharacterized protein YbcI
MQVSRLSDGSPGRQGTELQDVSNAMVRIYKERFGRGPTKARSGYADPDTLIATLEYTLTPAEATMAELGEHQRLEETRLFFQRATRNEFVQVVEQITGRTVRAFVSGMDSQVDVASEVFYLVPRDE